MADIEAMVRDAYAKFAAGDVEGLLAMFHDDAMFYVPGETRLSGDHPKSDFLSAIVGPVMEMSGGTFKEDILDVHTSDHGAAVVLHSSVQREGQEYNWHVVHVWDVKGDKFSAWWEYPHEYDQFQRAWS